MGQVSQSKKKAMLIAGLALNKKADDVVLLDMHKISNVCDYFVICSATSTRKTKAIADGIIDGLKAKKISIHHLEGYSQANWILLDCNDIVVHIFYDALRKFYNIEHLWADAKRIYPNQI